MTDNILESKTLENKQPDWKENNFIPNELNQKINKVGYSFLHRINDIKKQQEALEKKLEAEEKALDDFIDWLSDQINIGWEQGHDMSRISKEYIQLLKKKKDICHVGLLDYWGKA